MEKQELRLIQLQCQVIALESVVAAILSASTRSRAARQQLLQTLDQLPENILKTSLPELGPEYSDMLTAELKDAADSLVSFLKSHLSK